MTVSIPGIPAAVSNLIQDNTLERMFHDSLYPRLLYRSEAVPELWEANIGERVIFTRTGLLPVSKKPLTPGSDPTPSGYSIEQWEAEANQYGDTIDTHMPTSHVSLAPKFLRNTVQLGLNAGETLNQLVRDRLYRAYLGGNTVNTAVVAASTQIPVASLNGFTELLVDGRPQPVSPNNPVTAVVQEGTPIPINVVAAVPDDILNPFGPGTLTTDVAISIAAARTAVLADQRARIIRAGGGDSVDIPAGPTSVLTLQQVINAVARMRDAKVPPCSDGYYHVHLTPTGESQIFADNQWQRLHESLPDGAAYRDLAIGQLVGCRFYRNTENPNAGNTGTLVATGAQSSASGEVGSEIFNVDGAEVRRAIVLGGGAVYEKYLDESKYITEAGVTGKIGSFSVVNNGVQVMTNRIRYILRAPLDRLQQVVAQTWSWSGDFSIPSDQLTTDPARFKRATILEHL